MTVVARTQREIWVDALAIGAATGAYGVSFGAIAISSGLDVWQTQALSALMFTGASQFAFVAVIASGGVLAAAVATALLLGLRNGLYALALSRRLELRGWRRVLGAQVTIDESTALAVAQGDAADRATTRLAFFAAGGSVFVLWNLGTLIGALGAGAIGDPRTYGLDAAAAAAFLALLWPRLDRPEARWVAIAAGLLTLITVPVLSPGLPVLLSAVVALAVGWRQPRSAGSSTEAVNN